LQIRLGRVQFVHLERASRVCADGRNNCSAVSIDNLLVGEEERVRLIFVLRSRVLLQLIWVDHGYAVRPNDNAVGRDDVTGTEQHDVAYDQFPHVDSLHLRLLAAENGNFLVFGVGLQLDETSVLNPVIKGGDENHESEDDEDADTFSPASFGVVNHAEDHGENCTDSQGKEDPVLESVQERLSEFGELGSGLDVTAKVALAPHEVLLIAHDTALSFSLQFFE